MPDAIVAPAPAAAPETPAGGEIFKSLDTLFDAPPEAPEPSPTPAPEKPAKASEPAKAAPVAKATEKAADKPSEEPATGKNKPKTEGGALRENLEKANAKVAEYEAKLKDFEARGKDTAALTERLAALERERDEAKRDLAMARVEKTPEFKEKWEKPFNEAAEFAKERVEQFLVFENGVGRPANWEKDFGQVYALPYAAAKMRAKELFEDEAPAVMAEYDRLKLLDRAAAKAWENEKASYKTREAERVANQAKEREAYQAAYRATTEGWKKKYPERYGESVDDPKENEIFQKALEIVDSQPKTFAESVAKNTRVRLDAAALPRVEYRLQKALKELNELKAKFENRKSSAPGATGKTPAASAPVTEDEGDSFSPDALKKIFK